MKKPSEAQRDILRHLCKDNRTYIKLLRYHGHEWPLSVTLGFHDRGLDVDYSTFSRATFRVLERAGYVEKTPRGMPGEISIEYWRITDAGRQAIA